MASMRRIAFGLLFAGLASPVLAAPLEAYGKLPSLEIGAVSASGDQVAVVVTNGEERRIVVKDLVHNTTPLLATVGETKVRDLRWAGDQHLILTTSSTQKPMDLIAERSEWFFASQIDVSTKKLHSLLGDVEQTMNVVEGLPVVRTIAGRPLVFLQGVSFVNSHGVLALFQVDLEHAGTRRIDTGFKDTEDYVVGSDGQPLAQTLYDRQSGHWVLKARQGGIWRDVLTREDPIDPPETAGLGRSPRSLVLIDGEKNDFTWKEVSLDTGQMQDLPSASAQGAIHDPATGRLIGLHALEGDEDRYTFFDPADDRVWAAVRAAYGGDSVKLVSWSNDRRRILVRVDSATLGPAYAVVDLAERRGSWLGAEYEGLKAGDIGPVRPLRFKAADGLELTGYLTLPHGKDPKALPLIVLPHGGPAARDTPGFDWWAQAMASRGYAVLQVNYRGSEGFGWDFQKAGFGEWGRKMQTDLSDGVAYLAGQGIIDPKRVCIVGGSYGGYAALAGVTLQKGIYRCAVSFGGVTDLRGLIVYSRRRSGDEAQRYWNRYMGSEDLGDPVLARYSPALHAAEASAPILLIHGKDDTVVPLNESTEMADALRRAGKPVELVVQNNADHWLSLGATRLQMLQATMAFVEKNNPPN
jgi:dipeptidyl aminopeptidase/acylaminoacyl peptidase